MGRANGPRKLNFRAYATSGDLLIEMYGDIGESFFGDGITTQQVADALKTPHESITVRLNSPGGDAFEGVAIYNLLKGTKAPVRCIVDGLAASAASLVAMAGDVIEMGTGTMMMIHPAMMMTYGTSVEMHSAAEVLEQVSGAMSDIYAARSGQDRAKVLDMMYAETWMSPQEAIDLGFATALVTEESQAASVAAAYDLSVYAKTPDALKAFRSQPDETVASLSLREKERDLYGL
jgi:ATP-dependent protease ClpP protease subunit